MGSYVDHTTGSAKLDDIAISFSMPPWLRDQDELSPTGPNSADYDDATTTISPTDEDPYLYNTGTKSFEVPFLITCIIIGVIGNLVVVAVYRQKQYRHSNAALYILNLASGDLFLLLGVVLFHITEYYPRTWATVWRTDIQCILHRFGRFTGMNITIFTMVAIAFDRYIAVVHALEYKLRCPVKQTKRIILFMWVASAIAAGPSVINFAAKYGTIFAGENYVGKTPFACRVFFMGHIYGHFKIIYISVILFYVPAAITLVLYTIIVIYVWRNNQKFRRNTSKQATHDKRRNYWKTAQVLFVVFFVFAITYGILTTYTLAQLIYPALVPGWVKNVGLLLPYANSCMNPVLYSLINPRFRAALWSLVASKQPRKRRRVISRLANNKMDASSSNKSNVLPKDIRSANNKNSNSGNSNQTVNQTGQLYKCISQSTNTTSNGGSVTGRTDEPNGLDEIPGHNTSSGSTATRHHSDDICVGGTARRTENGTELDTSSDPRRRVDNTGKAEDSHQKSLDNCSSSIQASMNGCKVMNRGDEYGSEEVIEVKDRASTIRTESTSVGDDSDADIQAEIKIPEVTEEMKIEKCPSDSGVPSTETVGYAAIEDGKSARWNEVCWVIMLGNEVTGAASHMKNVANHDETSHIYDSTAEVTESDKHQPSIYNKSQEEALRSTVSYIHIGENSENNETSDQSTTVGRTIHQTCEQQTQWCVDTDKEGGSREEDAVEAASEITEAYANMEGHSSEKNETSDRSTTSGRTTHQTCEQQTQRYVKNDKEGASREEDAVEAAFEITEADANMEGHSSGGGKDVVRTATDCGEEEAVSLENKVTDITYSVVHEKAHGDEREVPIQIISGGERVSTVFNKCAPSLETIISLEEEEVEEEVEEASDGEAKGAYCNPGYDDDEAI